MVMQINQIYAKYQIMPQLATHMLRVGGVGKLILDGWSGEIDQDLVLRSLLLHDMGNMAKFDLSDAGQQKLRSVGPVDLPLWRERQESFWHTYGRDAHEATIAILRELGQTDVITVLEEDHIGYADGDAALLLKQGWPAKIVGYADIRVVPNGVVPMKERIADIHRRYGRALSWYDFLYELEREVAGMTTTDLSSITEADVLPFFDELLTYTI